MMRKIRIGVMVSGNGTNLQSIIDATHTEALSCAEVVLVISNKKDAYALKRAENEGIEALFSDPVNFSSREDYFEHITEKLEKKRVDLICLAGFLLKLEPNIVTRFRNRILNIHPALLPKFGGKGQYGTKVHEAVLSSKEKETGCTVHLVDEEYDHGATVMQKTVPILPKDTPEILAARVLKQEQALYPQAIRLVIEKEFLCAPVPFSDNVEIKRGHRA